MHIIKRKSHHRLFDMSAKRYVDRQQVRQLVDHGERIRIVDGRTGKDVTRETLPRILVPHRSEEPRIAETSFDDGARLAAEWVSWIADQGAGAVRWLGGRPGAVVAGFKAGIERVIHALAAPTRRARGWRVTSRHTVARRHTGHAGKRSSARR